MIGIKYWCCKNTAEKDDKGLYKPCTRKECQKLDGGGWLVSERNEMLNLNLVNRTIQDAVDAIKAQSKP